MDGCLNVSIVCRGVGNCQGPAENKQEDRKVRGVATIALLSWQRSCKTRFRKIFILGKYPVFLTASCAFGALADSSNGRGATDHAV
jgi:hypothetical protein